MRALARAITIFRTHKSFFLSLAVVMIALVSVSTFVLIGKAVNPVITVNKTDDHDDTLCDSSDCTLREAINLANIQTGSDTIEFNIPSLGQACNSGICTIALANALGALPALTDDGTTIDGLSQETNQSSNCQATAASTGPPCVVIDGTNVNANGLTLSGNNNLIKGLVIVNFTGHGIKITGDGNTVAQNYVGTAADGTTGAGNDLDGIDIDPADDNVIGPGNVISGNAGDGVDIDGDRNEIIGNIMGLGADGSTDLGNTLNGIRISGGTGNCIGGQDTDNSGSNACTPASGSGPFGGVGNIISKNGENGIHIGGGSSHSIFGNFIGLSQSGTVDKGNTLNGVFSTGASVASHIIGGDTVVNSRFRNVISGNDQNGIKFDDDGGSHTIQGNYIGTNADGTAAIANGGDGINIDPSENNTIGGNVATNPGLRNLISGNTGNGITIDGGVNTLVQGNYLGTQANGSCGAFTNGQDGVHLQNGATDNIIGASLGTNGIAAVGLGNTIACNTGDGVEVDGASTTRNFIRTNSITANGGDGIKLSNGANGGILPPTITAISSMSGTSAPGSDVDAYSDINGEGATYHGTDTADTNCGATCEFFVSGAISGPNGTATASHAAFGTSAFSAPLSANVAPSVNAGNNKTKHAGIPITQTGSFTDSNVGQTHTILWDIFVDGGHPNTSGCTLSGPANLLNVTVNTLTGPGVCTVRLTVTDNGSPALSGVSTFQIDTTNNAPFFASPVNQTVLAGQSVTLSANAKDPDNDTLTFLWSLVGGAGTAGCSLPGPNTNGTVLVQTSAVGTCIVKIDVNDGHGGTASTQVMITTTNQIPSVNAGPDQVVGVGQSVTLVAVASDPDNNSLSFTWSLVGGAGTAGCSFVGSTTNQTVIVQTSALGSCLVQVDVSDGQGGTASDQVLITTTTAPTCNVTATASATTLRFPKNWARIIKVTVVNAANSTGTATVNAIEAIVGKNLVVTYVKVGNKRLSLPFNINLPPGTQQIFVVRLKSLIKQTVTDPFVRVSGLCNNANFNVPVSAKLRFVPAVRLYPERLSAHVQAGQLVVIAQGINIQRVRFQLFDSAGRIVLEETAIGASLVRSLKTKLANGVYLVVITAQDIDGLKMSSEVKKLVIKR